MRLKNTVLSLGALLALASSGCVGQAHCEKLHECASDPPGEDFLRVCQVTYNGQIDAYRANKEEECHILAEAKLTYNSCTAQLECDEFREATRGTICQQVRQNDYRGECEPEAEAYCDALEDAEQECGTLD